jgi:hypothetical protein
LASTLFDSALLQKYHLPKEVIIDAVCIAISRTLGRAMGTKVFVCEGDSGIEIYALKKNIQTDDPVFRIKPGSIKTKLMRHLQHSIEIELHSRMVIKEFEQYRDLQSQLVNGFITNIQKDGTLEIGIEREHLFNQVVLYAVCPLRSQPQHERGKYQINRSYVFHVSKIRPGELRGMPRLEIRLDRTSPRITEGLIRIELEKAGIGLQSESNRFKCVNRTCGAFSHVVAEKRIAKPIIQAVRSELQESIIVKYGNNRHV